MHTSPRFPQRRYRLRRAVALARAGRAFAAVFAGPPHETTVVARAT